jgi:hypothetical protein
MVTHQKRLSFNGCPIIVALSFERDTAMDVAPVPILSFLLSPWQILLCPSTARDAASDLAHPLPMVDLDAPLDDLAAMLCSHLTTLYTELNGLIKHAGGEEAQGGVGQGQGDVARVPVLTPALVVLILLSRWKLGGLLDGGGELQY